MAKYCPKCNDLLDEKYSFCLGCGNEIGAEKRPFQKIIYSAIPVILAWIFIKNYYLPSYNTAKPFLQKRIGGFLNSITDVLNSSTYYDVHFRLIFLATLGAAFGFFFLLILLRRFD